MVTPESATGVFAFTWLALAMTLAPGSHTVFVIRSSLVGGLYLGYPAVQTFLGAWKTWGAQDQAPDAGANQPLAQAFRAGLLTNLVNPKTGAFYLSVLPGLLLGGIHAGWGVLWLSIVSFVAGWARNTLLRAQGRAVLDAVCGVLLLGFGVFVIVEVTNHLK